MLSNHTFFISPPISSSLVVKKCQEKISNRKWFLKTFKWSVLYASPFSPSVFSLSPSHRVFCVACCAAVLSNMASPCSNICRPSWVFSILDIPDYCGWTLLSSHLDSSNRSQTQESDQHQTERNVRVMEISVAPSVWSSSSDPIRTWHWFSSSALPHQHAFISKNGWIFHIRFLRLGPSISHNHTVNNVSSKERETWRRRPMIALLPAETDSFNRTKGNIRAWHSIHLACPPQVTVTVFHNIILRMRMLCK